MADEENENGEETGKWNPQDDAIAAGEHIPEETLEGGEMNLPAPSVVMNPYVSEEDQDMEMDAIVVGPPQYGSPDPTTSAGRLLPLDQHPLNAEALPADHPAAISEDYGEGYQRTVVGGVVERTDLENAMSGTSAVAAGNEEVDATDAARTLANDNNVDLNNVEGTGSDGRITKDDVQNYIDENADESDADESS